MVRERFKRGGCEGIVTEDYSELQKIGTELTDSWQRDLADFMSIAYMEEAVGKTQPSTKSSTVLQLSAM